MKLTNWWWWWWWSDC